MRVLLAGRRDLDYNRVRVLRAGLAKVAPGRFDVCEFGDRTPAAGRELERRAARSDVVYVPPFRARDVAFVKRHGAGRPVVFDPLIGSTITRVHDYGYWWRRPLAYLVDRRDFGRADHLIFDTEAHRRWAVETFGLSPTRVHVLYIGADTAAFPEVGVPERRAGDSVTVGFYGSFAPLQGAPLILEAAAALAHRADIRFEIVGDAAGNAAVRRARRRFARASVEYVPYLPFARLAARLRDYDICLGVFGESLKADVVVPNKLYHYAALGKPVITRDTRGARELFTDADALLVEPSAASLADAVEQLVGDPARAAQLGANAARLIRARLTERHVAERFLDICRAVIADP